jgi:peptidoglycan/LPS O-acetylase OafA/YrhL
MAFIIRTPDYNHGLVMCVMLVVLTLLVAPLTYHYLEVPARKYLNRLFAGKKQKVAA